MLAPAPFDQLLFRDMDGEGQEACPCMRLVAKGLILAESAAAPEVIPGFCLDPYGFFCGNTGEVFLDHGTVEFVAER